MSTAIRVKSEMVYLIRTYLVTRKEESPELAYLINSTLTHCDMTIGKLDKALDVLEAKGTLHQVSEALSQ